MSKVADDKLVKISSFENLHVFRHPWFRDMEEKHSLTTIGSDVSTGKNKVQYDANLQRRERRNIIKKSTRTGQSFLNMCRSW